mmetsp:Transcript_26390/g.87937  ORF Transcript_26390/g.87937 Transcript_26390/m.87937 type:complete len:285 (+) Transcript_26390:549-1403(+)
MRVPLVVPRRHAPERAVPPQQPRRGPEEEERVGREEQVILKHHGVRVAAPRRRSAQHRLQRRLEVARDLGVAGARKRRLEALLWRLVVAEDVADACRRLGRRRDLGAARVLRHVHRKVARHPHGADEAERAGEHVRPVVRHDDHRRARHATHRRVARAPVCLVLLWPRRSAARLCRRKSALLRLGLPPPLGPSDAVVRGGVLIGGALDPLRVLLLEGLHVLRQRRLCRLCRRPRFRIGDRRRRFGISSSRSRRSRVGFRRLVALWLPSQAQQNEIGVADSRRHH